MRRAPFLGAATAALFAGPSLLGRAVAKRIAPVRRVLRMVPAVAPPIPAAVLAKPILGEARRFDGSVAPQGWMLAQGQLLAIAANRKLFSIYGNQFGGDGRTTFALPQPLYGAVVAVTGLFPTRPSVLAQAGRHQGYRDSLGFGAAPGPPRPQKSASQGALEDRARAATAPRVGTAVPVPVSPELSTRIASSERDARTRAVAALGTESAAHLEDAIADALAGRTDVYGVVKRMTRVLSGDEARRLLALNDSVTRSFNRRAGAQIHPHPELEAAHFLAAVAIGRAQARAIYRRESATHAP